MFGCDDLFVWIWLWIWIGIWDVSCHVSTTSTKDIFFVCVCVCVSFFITSLHKGNTPEKNFPITSAVVRQISIRYTVHMLNISNVLINAMYYLIIH